MRSKYPPQLSEINFVIGIKRDNEIISDGFIFAVLFRNQADTMTNIGDKNASLHFCQRYWSSKFIFFL
jgi:hypothetical protein